MDLPALRETLATFLEEGGSVMGPLIGCAVVLWYALGYRLAVLRPGHAGPVTTLLARARTGALARPHGVLDTAVVRAAAVVARAGDTAAAFRQRLDLALADDCARLDRFAAVARTVVLVAPLAGLLGTVTGMIEMFDSLGSQQMHSQEGGIAAGIAEALLTTEMGLAIAIPGLIVSRLLERRAARLATEIDRVKACCQEQAA